MTVDTQSKELLASVTEGLDFSLPSVNQEDSALVVPESLSEALKDIPEKLTVDTLTEREVDGNGCFDAIMTALKAHLTVEYEAGRITGAEYTKAYIASLQGALQFAVQYLLGKDLAYYQALGAQAQALQGNIGAYTAKVQLAIAQAQAHNTKAEYASRVLQLSTVEPQIKHVAAQTALVEEQKNSQAETTKHITAQTTLTGAQTEVQQQQKNLLIEQAEQAHAQISDTRLDGRTPVAGYTGNQNSLLKQQVVSFKKDSIIKSAKIYADSFATQLSMSTTTSSGSGLDTASIKNAMDILKSSMTTL